MTNNSFCDISKRHKALHNDDWFENLPHKNMWWKN